METPALRAIALFGHRSTTVRKNVPGSRWSTWHTLPPPPGLTQRKHVMKKLATPYCFRCCTELFFNISGFSRYFRFPLFAPCVYFLPSLFYVDGCDHLSDSPTLEIRNATNPALAFRLTLEPNPRLGDNSCERK